MFASDALAMIGDWGVSISIGQSIITGMMCERLDTNTVEAGGYQDDGSQTCIFRTADYSAVPTIGQLITVDGIPQRIISYQLDLDKVIYQVRVKQVN